MSDETKLLESPTVKKLLCGRCGNHIAVVDIQNRWVHVKARKVSVSACIRGGCAKVKCLKCKIINIFIDPDCEKEKPAYAKKLRSERGICEPELRPWFIKLNSKDKGET